MEITWIQFLIVCPMLLLAGFVDAVAGGGGLISLPAYMIAGLPVHLAVGTNKLSMGMGTAMATFRYAKSGYIVWRQALPCAVCAVAGSFCGAKLALMLDDHYFRLFMLVLLPITAYYVLHSKSLDTERPAYPEQKTTMICMLLALVIGVYDGFYGPGTGTFLLLTLTALAHVTLKQANGTAKVINLTTNVTTLVVYLFHGQVVVLLALCAGGMAILGNFLGTRFFAKGGSVAVKPIMVSVLTLFFIRVILELCGVSF